MKPIGKEAKGMSKKEQMEQKIREQTRKITNLKAHIFDLIEDRTGVMNDIEKLKEKADSIGKNVLSQQNILNGDRKVLMQLKAEYEKEFPEVTVNKAE